MKILKHGKTKSTKYILNCPKCDCEAEFDRKDIKVDRDGDYVECPECGELIGIGSFAVREITEDRAPFTSGLCFLPNVGQRGFDDTE